MYTIGITGGVGAGKSLVLNYIKEHFNAKVYLADDIANELKLPGRPCFEPLVALLGKEVLDHDGTIHKGRMAEVIFSDPDKLAQANAILHPAVKAYVLEEIKKEREKAAIDFFILEAALLIEEGYDAILDELWYVRADESVRRGRLKESRGYSDEKIDSILKHQLTDQVFLEKCHRVIDNNDDPEGVKAKVKKALEEKTHAKG